MSARTLGIAIGVGLVVGIVVGVTAGLLDLSSEAMFAFAPVFGALTGVVVVVLARRRSGSTRR